MKISELVAELEKLQEAHGDVYVENENGVTVDVTYSEDGVVVIS